MMKTIPRLPGRVALFAVALAVLALLCGPAYAEGGVSAEIPLTVQAAEGTDAAEAVSYFSITAEEGTPMPLQSSLCIRGAGSGSFGPIGYTQPGDYSYTVRQTSAAAIFRRDATVYTVTVRIVNNAQGTLNAEVWAVREDAPTGKTTRLIFTAAPLASATPAPTATSAPAKATTTRAKVTARRAPQTADVSSPMLVLLCCIGSGAAAAVLYRRHKAG